MLHRTVLVYMAALAIATCLLWLPLREAFDDGDGGGADGNGADGGDGNGADGGDAGDGGDMDDAAAAAADDYSRTNEGLKPQSLDMFGRTHLYQVPPNPKGTVAMFPGCARRAVGFWPAGTCKDCQGFPEDVANAKQALRRGYAFIALSPRDAQDSCWSGKVDFPDAGSVLERFMSTHGLLNKPLYTMGASSGGQIALNMQAHAEANRLPFTVSGVISLVSTNVGPRVVKKQPPVVWVVMSEPKEKEKAEAHAAAVKKAGGAAAVVVSAKKKVTPTFFSDRMPVVSAAESAQMVAELVKAKVVDAASGAILKNPKSPKTWLASMKKALPALFKRPGVSADFWKSGIVQAMLNAYSKHEAVSEYTTAALEWFEGGAKANFAPMANTYRVAAPASLTI